MFVLRARKNSTINFQEYLGAWVRQCLFVSPSGMASQSSSSESQSLLISWRLLILGKMRTKSDPFEQIELQAKLLNYFLGSNKSNINQSTGVFFGS